MDITTLESLAKWSAPKELQTKVGPRILRKASVSPEFSAAWKTHKDEIKALGAGFGKDAYGNWELVWWQQVPDAVQSARKESVAASRAIASDVDLPCPAGLSYMPFQRAGIQYGIARPNVLIADEMGLGKTIQAIGIINADSAISSALVICPKSLKLNWIRELGKWLVRPLSVGAANGIYPNTDVVIINYDILGKFMGELTAKTWDVIIVDEAHLIKNSKTIRSKNVKSIKAKRNIRLTGTPIVNRPVELWNVIEDLCPEQFGQFWQFAKRYTNVQRTRFGWDFSGASNLDELQARLRENIMVRRLKADVLTDLPRKIRQIVPIEPSTDGMKDALRQEQDYNDRIDALQVAVELSKAESEQAYKDAVDALVAATVGFAELSKIRHDTAMSKIDAVITHVLECLEDNENKIIVAAHHHDVIDALMVGLEKYNPVCLYGAMDVDDRQASVDKFQSDPTCRVFVAGILAAGVGITLTASSHVVFAELDWVPGNVTQMEDRAHRIGQTQTVLVQHLVVDGSIDARMTQILVEKQAVIEQALDVNHPDRTVPVRPTHVVTDTVDTVSKIASTLTDEQVTEIHLKLKLLADMDGDRASDLNGIGFNKFDSAIGHSLAQQETLSPKQAALGLRLVTKYRKQVGGVSWL